ncbi:unnamed protein product [Dovyalis caffra]|uniref:Uncharacterized protein n=1 Tax=Dovyalis caffra TaxID=77055 RepID=A0AAV1SH81_9ROSI|nr:unnamed protein product [Dovyalis caffra]
MLDGDIVRVRKRTQGKQDGVPMEQALGTEQHVTQLFPSICLKPDKPFSPLPLNPHDYGSQTSRKREEKQLDQNSDCSSGKLSRYRRKISAIKMVQLFLREEAKRKEDVSEEDTERANRVISLLKQLESVIWSLITRSEARLWLCNTISCITSLTPYQKRELFVSLLRTTSKKGLASQLWQLIFQKRPHKAGNLLAKRSYVLDKFFEGNRTRILQWFSNFSSTGLGNKKGAKALSQFAFVNRNICWEELEWKGKHGQSPAVVATKPHYFLELDILRTVGNFLENVPDFWTSSEFADSLRDGDILFIETKFFVDFFVGWMYKEDSRDVWEVINEFFMEEPFSVLCQHLLITLEEREFCTFLESLCKFLNRRMEPDDFGDSSCLLEFVLSKFSGCESIDQLLLLNAVINQGRQLLKLLHDEESQEGQAKINDIVSGICRISSCTDSFVPILKECLNMKTTGAIKILGLHSWAFHYALSEKCQSPEAWESLFSNNGINFSKSDKFAPLHDDEFLEENDSELDDRASTKRKSRKKKKIKKKRRRNFDDDDSSDHDLLDLDTSNSKLGLQARAGSWLLSTDGFAATWTSADLPEHLSKSCFSTWMKWAFAKWNNAA